MHVQPPFLTSTHVQPNRYCKTADAIFFGNQSSCKLDVILASAECTDSGAALHRPSYKSLPENCKPSADEHNPQSVSEDSPVCPFSSQSRILSSTPRVR